MIVGNSKKNPSEVPEFRFLGWLEIGFSPNSLHNSVFLGYTMQRTQDTSFPARLCTLYVVLPQLPLTTKGEKKKTIADKSLLMKRNNKTIILH